SRVPIVAALQGRVFGAAFSWALLCDMRIVSPDATFGFPECSEGMIPEYGAFGRLCQIAGPGMASDLALTGRRLTAQEAVDHGLVPRLSESPSSLGTEALDLAGRLGVAPPYSVKTARGVVASLSNPVVEKSLWLEMLAQALVLESDDYAELRLARGEGR